MQQFFREDKSKYYIQPHSLKLWGFFMLMKQQNLHTWHSDRTQSLGQDTYGQEPHIPL
jgi:hypothetical protein